MASLGTVIGRGTFSARPAAGTAGSIYFDTTNSKQWRDNGTTWDDVTPTASVSDATTSAVGGVLVDHAPSGSHPVALTTDGTTLPSTMAVADGSLSAVSASKLTGSHTLPDGTLSTNVPLLNAANVFTAKQEVSAFRITPGGTTGAPTSGAHVVGDVYTDSAGTLYVCTAAGTPGTWAAAGSGGSSSLTTASAQLSANVTLTNANQFYDGPSVSLAAGTWLLFATAQLNNPTTTGAQSWTGKLWDGTTAYNSGQETTTNNGTPVSLALSALVTPTGTTTYKLSVANITANSVLYAAALNNGAGNNASSLFAVKVG